MSLRELLIERLESRMARPIGRYDRRSGLTGATRIQQLRDGLLDQGIGLAPFRVCQPAQLLPQRRIDLYGQGFSGLCHRIDSV